MPESPTHPSQSAQPPAAPTSREPHDGFDHSWRSLWLSSGALSIGQIGDALMYVVLPVNAALFGVSLPWVGVLLAANRIIRIFTYGPIARLGEHIGLKRLCVCACVTALISTAMCGWFQGGNLLLAARCLWGLSYAALLLVALGYAAADRTRVGSRVGVSRAIEQIGPLIALTFGAWLAGKIGPQPTLLWFAVGTLVAVAMALLMAPTPSRASASAATTKGTARGSITGLAVPDRLDVLIFWVGAGVDGVFSMTLTLMLAEETSLEVAMVSGGLIIVARRIAEMISGPLSGAIADRYGVRQPLLLTSVLLVIGFALVGGGWLISGALAIVLARGALSTLIPAGVTRFASGAVLGPLARNQTWRDVGAGIGPLSSGFLLAVTSPRALHSILAVIIAICLVWVMRWPRWRELNP